MKPLHLNLASRPYRDYRPFTLVVAVTAVIIFALAYVNVDTYLRYKTATRHTSADIERLQRLTADERRAADAATARLRSVDVKQLAAQTEFANARLAERAFSWSELLDRLEHVVPQEVRIESVSPSFDKGGLVHLTLACFGKSGDSMVATIENLNRDPQFAGAFPNAETKTDKEYRFGISVDYRPTIARIVE